ncbi:MAG TPA: hypothetical protein VEJ38_17485 [Candidatus Acidoferrales bacterium]|nr:hypothetical protein [Candidatus Acidoferrales bacterium]
MVVLGAVILSLASVFMGFCLLRFQRELARSRNRVTCCGLSVPNSRGGAGALELRGKVVELRAARIAVAQRLVNSQFAPPDSSEYASTILTLGKRRLAVLPSRTARLAEKRAAKG